jgi:signal transduction histidine kinase
MRELLEYGKPQNENISAGSLEPIIDQAIQASTLLARRLKVNIEKRIAVGLPPASIDRTRVFQLFQNLLDNALRHSPAGGAVVIEAEVIDKDERVWIECRVKDSGTGFRPEDLPKVYEPFFTRRRGGTGLGLAIVQRIAEQHGGNAAAANRPEGGAVVAVRFPAAVE